MWTLWFTYGAFYFCRTNLSAAIPGMKSSEADGGLGLSGEQVGWILASLKMAYGIGQLINGQLSERFRPRLLLAIGMFGSAALNIAFGLSSGFFFLLFVWASNGYCQSLGWTPCMRVIGNWFPITSRGKVLGIIGTGYQITLGLTYLVASYSVEAFGWRGAVFVPSAILALLGIGMLVLLKESPDESVDSNSGEDGVAPVERRPFRENLYLTLFNPGLWLIGISLGLLNACRYGFLDWGLTHLVEVQESTIGKSGLKYCLIAPGAAAGAYLSGWATDRFFNSRRAPVIFGLLVLLGILTLLYEVVARSTEAWATPALCVLLVLLGFCIYGPQVLLVGTAPADLAHRGTTAAAAGFVNFIGYTGAATGDVVTGYYSDDWQIAIRIWAGWAFAAAACVALLWNTTADRVGFLPSVAPKAAGTAGMIAMVAALISGGSPIELTALLALGLLPMLASCRIRRVAVFTPAFAGMGIVYFFSCYAVSFGGVAWHLAAGLVGCGVTLISSIMILTDER
jgi:OPA family glycerol-3-phosphate transporter-like MFS transporter